MYKNVLNIIVYYMENCKEPNVYQKIMDKL
jgi:hypothetical protein